MAEPGEVRAVERDDEPYTSTDIHLRLCDRPDFALVESTEEICAIVLAYSPLGRGFLAGKYKSASDLGGRRQTSPTVSRIQNFKSNKAIVDGVQKAIAQKEGITVAQLRIAWVSALGPHILPILGSSKEERAAENVAATKVQLTPSGLEEIKKLLQDNPVKGGRYGADDEDFHL